MVLQGEGAGFSVPFDAPSYGGRRGRSTPASELEFEYRNASVLLSYFSIDNDRIADVLPEGIEPYASPTYGIAWVSEYPQSTLGEYREFISLIQVEDPDGEMAYYCPYIYVDNGPAMAAGREVFGAPKKLAEISLERDNGQVLGTLERPAGKRLATLTIEPTQRVQDNAVLETAMPDPVPLLSLRHLPPIAGGDGITQLVEWYARTHIHEDAQGRPDSWMGPSSLTYDSPSESDPIHNLRVDRELLTMYAEMDLELGSRRVREEWRI